MCVLWNNKNKIRQEPGKLIQPSFGEGIASSVADAGLDLLIHKGIPWVGKKSFEAERYYASEAMRNPKLQKKAIDFALEKATPFIEKSGNEALDQLATKVRPKKKYKTDRKDLDGGSLIDSALSSGFQGGPWHADVKKGIKLLTDPELFAPVEKMPVGDAKKLVQNYKDSYKEAKKNGYTGSYNKYVKEMGWGAGLDIHKLIGKLPKPKKGWTLPGHKYTGPYDNLDSQVRYNLVTGETLEIYDQPTGKTDSIAMQHAIDYSVCKDDKKCKNEADRRMVKALDTVPYNERQWGHWLARNAINTKQKLGLSVQGNVKGRRVGKSN